MLQAGAAFCNAEGFSAVITEFLEKAVLRKRRRKTYNSKPRCSGHSLAREADCPW